MRAMLFAYATGITLGLVYFAIIGLSHH